MQLSRKHTLLGMTAAIGMLLVGAGLFVWRRGAGPSDGMEAEIIAFEDLKNERQVTSRSVAQAGQPSTIDLLDLIKVQRDSMAGLWGFQGRSLITSSVPWGRLQVPCVPPEEYDLKMVVTRRRGMKSLDVGFVFGNRQGLIRLDGQEGETSWIELTTGYELDANPTRRSGRLFPWRKARTLDLSVRKTGVGLSVDGKKIIEWSGDASEIGLQPGHRVPNPKALLIGSCDAVFEISEMTLIPVTGSATILQ